MGLPSRDDIHEYVVDKDLPLVRLLFFNRWFRLAFFLFLLLVVGLPLSLVKFWTSTPEGFLPEVKVSVVDRIQAWSLYRSAKSAWANGDGERAVHAWLGAIANDPGKEEVCRGFLDLILDVDPQRRYRREAAQNSYWLLRLGQTNLVDVGLVIRTFEHYELDGHSLELLRRLEAPLSPELERARLKALFLHGDLSQFEQEWDKLPSEVFEDPELELFRATFLAGWGNPDEISENRNRLKRAMDSEATRELAHRLNLSVSYVRLDAPGYNESLGFLESRQLDRPSYHLNYWNLLAELDRRSEAIELAIQYAKPPRSAVEATMFAETFIRLGLKDLAFQFLQRYSIDYASYEGVWYTQAEILSVDERWDDLFYLAIEMRKAKALTDSLLAYSYFIEGKAEVKRGRWPAAREAFRSMGRFSLLGGHMGLHIASNLREWEYYREARDVLVSVKDRYADKLVFWELLFEVGNELRSSRDLLMATENLFRLRPNDFAAKNNYAAMLLSLRIRPEEAISLTIQGLNQDEGSNSAKINHAHALLLNQREEEAAKLLEAINEKPLIEPLKHGYYLAWLEIEYSRGRAAEAQQ